MARGDVRAAMLALLAVKPMHGYQIIQELEERSEGRWRPSAGSVYPTLQQLEDEGLVHGEAIEGRRVFSLTDSGQAEVARRGETAGTPWKAAGPVGDEAEIDLRRLSFQLGAAAMQVAQVGSLRSTDQARAILTEARRQIYRLLAEDESSDSAEEGRPTEAPETGL